MRGRLSPSVGAVAVNHSGRPRIFCFVFFCSALRPAADLRRQLVSALCCRSNNALLPVRTLSAHDYRQVSPITFALCRS